MERVHGYFFVAIFLFIKLKYTDFLRFPFGLTDERTDGSVGPFVGKGKGQQQISRTFVVACDGTRMYARPYDEWTRSSFF